MKIETVYDNSGELLGDEYVDLSSLQGKTKESIVQMIYLDETLRVVIETLHEPSSKQ